MQLYNDYAAYLKSKYGCRVYRIGLDGGFSCPNRDGTKGAEGCVFCNADGSRSYYTNPAQSVKEQLASRIDYLKQARHAAKFIAYFQAFTGTYAPIKTLKKAYDQILDFDEIVGLSIGTRPDAIDAEKLGLISSYRDRYEVWIEFGLQSAHNRTLEAINRGHTFEEFVTASELADKAGVKICAHVILGLPGETREDMLKTAGRLSALKVDGVKIHLLHILRGSPLEKLYDEGGVRVLTQADYVELVCDFLENLSPDIMIQRLTGEGTRANHVAPLWALDKIGTINKIKEELIHRKSCQGFKNFSIGH